MSISRRPSKQIIGQSLISPISAPPRTRQVAWAGPEPDLAMSFSRKESRESLLPESPRSDDFHRVPQSDYPSEPMYNRYQQEETNRVYPKRELEPMDLPYELLPGILKFVDVQDLSKWMTVSKLWSSTIFPMVYNNISFGRNSGRAVQKLIKLLEESHPYSESEWSERAIAVNYKSHIQTLHFHNIVFMQPGDHQLVWQDVKSLITILAPTLEGLFLEFDDISFLSLSVDYPWLDSEFRFKSLDTLRITSKSNSLPDALIISFLRKCDQQMLTRIEISKCLETFSGTLWYLLQDKISPYVKSLVLTPSLKSEGWDEALFQKGFLEIVKTSAFLTKVDISGHRFGVTDKSLCILMELGNDLKEIRLPCGLNDTHLITLMSCSNIGRIQTLDFSCQCAIGRFKEIKKDGWPCNRFTDSVLIALLEKLMADNRDLRKRLDINKKGYQKMEIVLPRFIMEVRTGKKIPTLQWATQFRGFASDSRDRDAIFYRSFRLYSPGSRLIL